MLCDGVDAKAKVKYEYVGYKSCEAANLYSAGPKACFFGCIGYGDCVRVCNFDAVKIKDGIVEIDEKKCTGCEACVAVCPKGIIKIIGADSKVYVKCASKDPGKDVRLVCSTGCIACKICEKNCPHKAIVCVDNLACIEYAKCVSCGICIAKCPVKVIKDRIKFRPKMLINGKCIGCAKCSKICPINAIYGEINSKYEIIQDKCIGCAECLKVCTSNAITAFGLDAVHGDNSQ